MDQIKDLFVKGSLSMWPVEENSCRIEYCDRLQTWFNLHFRSERDLNGTIGQRESGCHGCSHDRLT